jgi:hypothetical protein
MATDLVTRYALRADIFDPDVNGITDGENQGREGFGYTWQVTPEWISSANQIAGLECEVWPRPDEEHHGDRGWFTTLRRVYPSGNMALADWTQIYGTWSARGIYQRTWLVCRHPAGGSIKSVSTTLGAAGAQFYAFVASGARNEALPARVRVAFFDRANGIYYWDVSIPRSGTNPATILTLLNDVQQIAIEEQPLSDPLGRNASQVSYFEISLTYLHGALYFQSTGREHVVAEHSPSGVPPTGQVIIEFINCSGRVFGGQCTWRTSGTVQPRKGIVVASTKKELDLAKTHAAFHNTGNTVSGYIDYYEFAGDEYTHPYLLLEGNGTGTPMLHGISLYSQNEVKTREGAETARDHTDFGIIRSADWTLRKRGSSGSLEMDLNRGITGDVPFTNSLMEMNCEIHMQDGSLQVFKDFEMWFYVQQGFDPNQPNRRRAVLTFRDWLGSRLRMKRMEHMPDFSDWELHDMITYVLKDRWNVPETDFELPDENPTLKLQEVSRLGFSPQMDGPGFCDAVARMLGQDCIVEQPFHKIKWIDRVVEGVAAVILDDANTSELDFVIDIGQSGDLDDLATHALVFSEDIYGRSLAFEHSDPTFINNRDRAGYCGDSQWWIDQVEATNPQNVAERSVGHPELYGIRWTGPARFGEDYMPGKLIEIGNMDNTTLLPGTRFEIIERTVQLSSPMIPSATTMKIIGRELL